MPYAKLSSRVSLLAGLGLFVAGAAGACSANNGNSLFTGSGSGATGGSGSGTGNGLTTGNGNGSSNGGSGGFVLSGTGTGNGSGTGGTAACQAETHQAMTLPLDMYIMEDQSGSMDDMISTGGTKWQAVTGALTAFVQQPGVAGISVGIQYFDLPPGGGGPMCNPTAVCQSDADCGPAACGPCMQVIPGFGICAGASAGGSDSCDPADYAKPDVEIAPLPGVASAIVTSLGNHSPSTNTATAPALQGALNHAKDWANSHPGHVVIAVLATDGEPNTCSPTDQAGVAQIAATALAGTPSIKTFAIGVFAQADIPSGPDLLNAVAQAGGTGQAFNIDTTQNVSQAFLQALNQIRGSALGCQYQIPMPSSGSNADPSKINVQYTPGNGGSPEIIPQVPNMGACPASGDAWYYDNPQAPTQILFCPAFCNKVSADTNGKIEILLGCKTVTAT
jgi:hypothetical protein